MYGRGFTIYELRFLWRRCFCGQRWRSRRSRRCQIIQHPKTPDHLPFIAHENLHFVFAGQPAVDRRGAFGIAANAACTTVPGFGFVTDQLRVAIPERRPLHAGQGVVVIEAAIHGGDGKLENRLRVHGVDAVKLGGELNGGEQRLRVWRDRPLEQGFDGKRQKGREG